jgi:hypothetical protein
MFQFGSANVRTPRSSPSRAISLNLKPTTAGSYRDGSREASAPGARSVTGGGRLPRRGVTADKAIADHRPVALENRDYMKAEGWQRRQRERLATWQWRTFPRRSSARRGGFATYAVVALLALMPGLLIGYAAGAGLGPFAPHDRPALMWGGESFESRAEFEAWLAVRGIPYAVWAQQHPAAAAMLDR